MKDAAWLQRVYTKRRANEKHHPGAEAHLTFRVEIQLTAEDAENAEKDKRLFRIALTKKQGRSVLRPCWFK